MNLTPLGYAAMFGWIPLVLLLFAALPPRRAVLVSFIGAWLFLPMMGWDLKGLPDYTKVSATSVGALLGIVLFDPGRLLQFRWRWLDLPMALWCIAPFFSSLANNLGAYDGLSETLTQVVTWGIPYFIGRIYFNDLMGLRELTVAIFVGGLIYVPLCLYEIRFSPQLHRIIYGYHQHSFAQTFRFGGFRPMVFMQHGLMVGMWMGMATLAGLWLAWSGALRWFLGWSVWWWVAGLGVVAILCKSAFAVLLMLVGSATLLAIRWQNWRWPLAALAAVPLLYMVLRQTDVLSAHWLVDTAATLTNEHRAASLAVRLEQERLFSEKAFERPIFGWGGWRRSFPEDRSTQGGRAVDSQWIIALGRNGLFGLGALTAALLLPVWAMCQRVPAASWRHPVMAGLIVIALQVTLYSIDNLLNAMINPAFLLGLGGLTGVVAVMRPSLFAVPPSAISSGPNLASARHTPPYVT